MNATRVGSLVTVCQGRRVPHGRERETFTMTDDEAEIRRAFHDVVNMKPAALRTWLATADSEQVGMVRGTGLKADGAEGESVGHHMGNRILEIAATRQADLTDADHADMRKVVGYVHRHLKQRPAGDVTDTKWRRSLMNWGHDPLK